MRALLTRPKKAYLFLGVAIVVCFAVSAVGHTGTPAQQEASDVAWIGSLGWAGFLLSLLAVLVFSLALLVHRLRMRPSSDGSRHAVHEERA
jgi:uncharacterized membrane protein YhaH (DUF805 family)